MAKCNSCGAESTRIRTTFESGGRPLQEPKDSCPNCDPEAFAGKFSNPSDKKIVAGWYAEPHKYRKVDDPDGGSMYIAKPETIADNHEWVNRSDEDEEIRIQRATVKRRQYASTRRQAETPQEAAENAARAREVLREIGL